MKPPPPPPPPPCFGYRRQAVHAKALYTWDSQQGGELAITAGDMLTVINMHFANGWVTCLRGGTRGIVPSRYLGQVRLRLENNMNLVCACQAGAGDPANLVVSGTE